MSLNLNGQKQSKGKSSKEKIRELEQLVQSTNMSLQMSQQMIKFLSDRITAMEKDIKSTMSVSNELDYRTLSLVEFLKVDKTKLDKIADGKKEKVFNDASDKEDKEKGYVMGDVVEEDSIVIVTSTTEGEEDQGIFRSKVPLAEVFQEDLKEQLLGSKIGDTFENKLGEVNHTFTVLGIRKPSAQPPVDIVDNDLTVEEESEVNNEEEQSS